MLKKFFLNFLSSFVGAWVALALFGIAAVFVGIGFIARLGSSEPVQKVSKHSILKIDLSGEIIETEVGIGPDYRSLLSGNLEKPLTLNTLVESIKEGKVNKNIDAMLIDCNGVAASPATLNALREAVVDFRSSGKKVYAYADDYSTGDYYVASAADSIFVNPAGAVSLAGPASGVIYMKSLLDKVGVTMQVVKVGTFKSAVEPYIMDEMSEPARAQLDTLFSNMWIYMRERICDQRKNLTPAKIDSLIMKDYISYSPVKLAVENKVVDKAFYRRELSKRLADNLGQDEKKLNFVAPELLIGQTNWGMEYTSSNQIAVLYACGDIAESDNAGINCAKLVPVITELADNENVKGLVLRVNSPGGSVFGSDQIGEALAYFKSKKKPMAVSMGDYAASGGYWISCDGDRIFADPLTITGSIGIFGMFPNISNLTDKLGVTMNYVSSTPGVDFPSLFKIMTPSQQEVMQKYVNDGYDKFINRVAKGRDMKPGQVRRIAEGRVWDGQKALKIGLVDELGGLQKAIEWVAKKAEIENKYDTAIYPQLEMNFWNMMSGNLSMMTKSILLNRLMGKGDEELLGAYVMQLLEQKPIQARMIPLDVKMN